MINIAVNLQYIKLCEGCEHMKLKANKNNMVELEQGKLELFVDQRYMDSPMGTQFGNCVEAFGLLPYRYYKNPNDKTPSEIGTLNNPTIAKFHPVTIDTNQTVQIYKNSKEKKYTVLTFESGTDMWSIYNIKALANAEIFLHAIMMGKLDNNIPYTMIVPAWLKNQEMNSVSLNVPATILELFVHVVCRDPKTGKPFGEVLAKDPNHSVIGYTFINSRRAAASSVFGGLSFEDQNAMLDIAINMTRDEKEQRLSPLEKIIKY